MSEIHRILDNRMNAFAPEIAKRAYLDDRTERLIQLRKAVNGIATNTDSCSFYRVQDAAFVYFDESRMAYSTTIDGLVRVLRDVLNDTGWCVVYYDSDKIPTKVWEYINDRRLDEGSEADDE